VIPKREVCRW